MNQKFVCMQYTLNDSNKPPRKIIERTQQQKITVWRKHKYICNISITLQHTPTINAGAHPCHQNALVGGQNRGDLQPRDYTCGTKQFIWSWSHPNNYMIRGTRITHVQAPCVVKALRMPCILYYMRITFRGLQLCNSSSCHQIDRFALFKRGWSFPRSIRLLKEHDGNKYKGSLTPSPNIVHLMPTSIGDR
jgi:hypothetical protein